MNKHRHEDGRPFTKEEFLKKLETDNEFNIEFGNKGIDQISDLIKQLKENPDSRRLIVNAWAVDDLSEMVLPPCHYGFQVYTRELSLRERMNLCREKLDDTDDGEILLPSDIEYRMNNYWGIPTRAISLMWNQRSVDTFLGLPFNIASYGLLLEIIAKEVGMIPDELIGNLGDVHLYSNHIEQAKEQIGRKLTFDERYALFTGHDTTWEEEGGNSYGKINGLDMMDDKGIPTKTREPYPLPTVEITHREWYQHEKVKEHLGEKTFSEKILLLRPDCFELINYQSHPKIKAPLSN